MLERLSVRGLGIISDIELEFGEGFSVLTGETGAGKSLLVESLKLLAGGRAQSDMVRSGDSRLRVEGVFVVPRGTPLDAVLDDLGVRPSQAIVLRRELTGEGRGRAWINDVTVTAGALQRVAPYLLAIHGQHEQHGLADSDVQRRLVDDYGAHHELLQRTRTLYATWREASAELDRLREQQKSRRDRLDTISFQLQEIDAVNPEDGEDEELRRRRLVLRHAARLADLRSSLLARLSDGESAVVDELARAERAVEDMAECGVSFETGVGHLVEARINVEELVREIQSLGDVIDINPGELDVAESRLHALDQLMLKYGGTLSDVLAHRNVLVQERSELLSVEERLDAAEDAANAALRNFDASARELDTARLATGIELTAAVEEVLARLAMDGTRLEFRWRPRIDSSSPLSRDGERVAFDADGVNECVLLIAANPGEEPRPMARIASGGELSRVHLAIRTVLRQRRSVVGLTQLFDEVDSGLGGATAAALADLLSDLSVEDQVLVVTHLPQVAAKARGHFRVEKIVSEDRATTHVSPLEDEQRASEVARMLAGEGLTDSALAHARTLLEE
jgi:DNA repair protein RecN (Recombination protein N)